MEPIRIAGMVLVFFGVALGGIEMGRDLDETWMAVMMPLSMLLLVGVLWFIRPAIPLVLAHIVGLGGWIFYVGGVVSAVVFASRMLVIG